MKHYLFSVLVALCLIAVTVPAHATDLEDAVDEYNGLASNLQLVWDDYVPAHETAFQDYSDMMENLYLYVQAEDMVEAEMYWTEHLAAESRLKNQSGPLVDEYLDEMIFNIREVLAALKNVVELDALSPSEVAYESGSPIFIMPNQPFPFWNDETHPEITQFFEFTFPTIAVGDPSTHFSLLPANLDQAITWFQIWDWISLGLFIVEHGDDGREMNATLAGEFDLLCFICLNGLAHLLPPDYDPEELEFWCEFLVEIGFCDDDLSDWEKASWVRRAFPRKFINDLRHIENLVVDQIGERYLSMIIWLPIADPLI